MNAVPRDRDLRPYALPYRRGLSLPSGSSDSATGAKIRSRVGGPHHPNHAVRQPTGTRRRQVRAAVHRADGVTGRYRRYLAIARPRRSFVFPGPSRGSRRRAGDNAHMTKISVPVFLSSGVQWQTGVSFTVGRAERLIHATQWQRKTRVLAGGRLGLNRSRVGEYESGRPRDIPQSI